MSNVIKDRFFKIVRSNNVHWLEKFLKSNYYFDVNSVDSDGKNALHIATGKTMIDFLINHRVNPFHKDYADKLPVAYCNKDGVKVIFAKQGIETGLKEYDYTVTGLTVGKVVELNKHSIVFQTNKKQFLVIKCSEFTKSVKLNKLYFISQKNDSYSISLI